MSENPLDRVTVAPEVLITIAKLTALGVPGVRKVAPVSGSVNRLFKKGTGDGVRIEVEDNTIYIELHLILNQDVNIREVSRNVQKNVARAIEEMAGMDVGYVNINIENIDYEDSEA